MARQSMASPPPSLPSVSRVRGQETIWDDFQFEGVACDPAEDKARQEFKNEADTEYQVKRFGAGIPFPPINGGKFVDFDMDLLAAFQKVEEARQGWLRLPEAVRQKYPTWQLLEQAAVSGELSQFLKTPAPPAGGSAGGDGGLPSDSAAGGGQTPA